MSIQEHSEDLEAQAAEAFAPLEAEAQAAAVKLAAREAIDNMQAGPEMDKLLAIGLGWGSLVDWGMGIMGRPPKWCNHLADPQTGLATLPPLSTDWQAFDRYVMAPVIPKLTYLSNFTQYQRGEDQPFDVERARAAVSRVSVVAVFAKEWGGGQGSRRR